MDFQLNYKLKNKMMNSAKDQTMIVQCTVYK